MAWGPKSEQPKLDVKLDELHMQIIEDEHLATWFIIEASIYDNEAESMHQERLVVPGYMLEHLIMFLPRFFDLYKHSR